MYYPNTVLCQGFLAGWRIFLPQRKANLGKAITSLQFLSEPSKNIAILRQGHRQIIAESNVLENSLFHSAIEYALEKPYNLTYLAIISPLRKAENITCLLIKSPLDICFGIFFQTNVFH